MYLLQVIKTFQKLERKKSTKNHSDKVWGWLKTHIRSCENRVQIEAAWRQEIVKQISLFSELQ